MRRAYPALFCFQEVIENFWKVFSQLQIREGSATRKFNPKACATRPNIGVVWTEHVRRGAFRHKNYG